MRKSRKLGCVVALTAVTYCAVQALTKSPLWLAAEAVITVASVVAFVLTVDATPDKTFETWNTYNLDGAENISLYEARQRAEKLHSN